MNEVLLNDRTHVINNCSICGTEYTQQKRLWIKAKFKDRCPQHRYKIRLCIDCGDQIYRGSKRCKPCAAKLRLAPRKNCVDCGSEISRKAESRCLSCWNKKQNIGATKERTKFNASKKWEVARKACFERDDYTCQHCKARGGYIEAHHILEWCNYPELRLDIENLLTLCRPCHRLHHKKSGRPRKWVK